MPVGLFCFISPSVLGTTVGENVIPRNWGTAKCKTYHRLYGRWLCWDQGSESNLVVLPKRARSDGELSYRKEQRGGPGGAGVSGSVEGTAGQLAVKGHSQLLARGGRTLGSSVFQNPEFWSQPAPDAGKLHSGQAGQGSSACPTSERFSVREGAGDGYWQREEGKT